MTLAWARSQLGELAPLAMFGQRVRSSYGAEPQVKVMSALTLASGSVREHVDALRDGTKLPVLTGDDDSLPWAVAAASVLLGPDVAELVPDRFTSGGQLDHIDWSRLCARARDIVWEARDFADLPENVREVIADPPLAALARFIIDSAGVVPIVVLDGPVPAAAALLADAEKPGASAHLVSLQPGTSNLEAVILDRLSMAPVLPWHTNLKDGSLTSLALSAGALAAAALGRLA